MERFANDVQTALSVAIADGVATAITVASGASFPAVNFRVRVDNELMLVTNVGAGTNWTVTRGIEGSAASAHSAGAPVVHVLTAGGLAQGISDIIVAAGFAVAATTLAGYGITDAYTKAQADARYAAVATTLAGYGITDAYTKAQSDANYLAIAGTAANASQLLGATWASPAAIGNSTPAGGAFTTLSASSTVSGAGFSTYLASPPAIGGTAPAAGTFSPLTVGSATQVTLQCDAANVLSIRNATNAQSVYIYNTFTDASNYERSFAKWVTGTFQIGTEKLGTGVARSVAVVSANNISFQAGSFNSWQINSTAGHILALASNTYDIGDATHLVRNLFIGGAPVLKVKAGVPVDGDFTNPTDGMICVDSADSKIYARIGGAWKGAVVA